jgi:hypothetical protein
MIKEETRNKNYRQQITIMHFITVTTPPKKKNMGKTVKRQKCEEI